MRIKRWVALILLGLVGAGVGVLLIANLFAYELTARVGGPLAASFWGTLASVVGIGLVIAGVRGLVRSIASALLPHSEDRLADVVWQQRRRDSGVRVLAIGGGTGLATLLRGLKGSTSNLTAIVAVSDDGGSSGRLQRELGVLPPGDIRNCLAALADDEQLMSQLLRYRFDGEAGDLSGHSLGNLLIAALTQIAGDFDEAVRQMHEILAIRGRVLPPTTVRLALCAELSDGSHVKGETKVSKAGSIKRVYLDPPDPPALPEALEAIYDAELVVIGPGSLYTSVLPNLLVPDIARALRETSAVRVYVCNVMTQPGETDGYRASDHVAAIEAHLGSPVFEYVLVNDARPDRQVLARYAAEKADMVVPDVYTLARMGYIPVRRSLISHDNWARHDPKKLARALLSLAERELAVAL
ncbi:MAG: YvcK family protein [Armatimonadetes bacterium]|nr:YvcK family protein [Armatimonadota bacterium]